MGNVRLTAVTLASNSWYASLQNVVVVHADPHPVCVNLSSSFPYTIARHLPLSGRDGTLLCRVSQITHL